MEAGIIKISTIGSLTAQCVDDDIELVRYYYEQSGKNNTPSSLSFDAQHLCPRDIPHILSAVRFFCEVEDISRRLLREVAISCTENTTDVLQWVFTHVRTPQRPTVVSTATRSMLFCKECKESQTIAKGELVEKQIAH